MSHFFGDVDAAAIVMEHCRNTGQKFTLYPLRSGDPRENPENEYVTWRELNWNHVGHLHGGDKVSFQDVKGSFWEIYIHELPRPVDRSGLEQLEKIKEAQKRVRGN